MLVPLSQNFQNFNFLIKYKSSESLEPNKNDLGASPKQKFEFARFYDEKQ